MKEIIKSVRQNLLIGITIFTSVTCASLYAEYRNKDVKAIESKKQDDIRAIESKRQNDIRTAVLEMRDILKNGLDVKVTLED